MSSRNVVAIILVTLGIVVLAYSGISFRTRGQPVDIGPLHVETTRSHFIPPVAGALALVGGILLWAVGSKKD
jgi:drug/metabolite transporter (DMT)-like permease